MTEGQITIGSRVRVKGTRFDGQEYRVKDVRGEIICLPIAMGDVWFTADELELLPTETPECVQCGVERRPPPCNKYHPMRGRGAAFASDGFTLCADCGCKYSEHAPEQARPTSGPFKVGLEPFTCQREKGNPRDVHWPLFDAECGCIAHVFSREYAELCADALNVHAETGLTPAQLAEQLDIAQRLWGDDVEQIRGDNRKTRLAELEQLAALTKQRDELLAALKLTVDSLEALGAENGTLRFAHQAIANAEER